MTIDPASGRLAFPEFGLVVDPSLTHAQFLRAPTGAVSLGRLRHDPSFRYQLPTLPQPDSALYVVVQFHYERLVTISLFHHAERFDHPLEGESEAAEMARQTFHEQWLTSQFGLICQHYRWGEVSSKYDSVARTSSIVIEYAKPNAWRTVGRTAGRLWSAVSTKK